MQWHLEELEAGLAGRGWRIAEVLPGDGYRVSASWRIERAGQQLTIDFDGLDDMETLPIERAYACRVRERPELSLYFGKHPSGRRPNRPWPDDCDHFLEALGRV